MSYVTHEEEIDGFTIKIIQDDDNFNDPIKDWDMVGTQVYWHKRYSLGHKQPKGHPEEWFRNIVSDYSEIVKTKEFKTWLKNNLEYGIYEYVEELDLKALWGWFETKNLIIPVYFYEHGGITIKANSKRIGWDSFDSGQLGFVYASHEKILEVFGGKRITKKLLERAEKCLIQEVETYDDYLTGNVWGFRIEDENGDDLDSCWGFVGDYKYCLKDAKSSLEYHIKEREKEMKLLDKRMIGEPT